MLELHAADRAETLVDLLVGVLGAPLADPFEREWVAVSSLGMRRWLTQQLSRRLGAGSSADGVAANIDLPFPAALRRSVLDAERDGVPDPWQVDRLVWPVLEVLHGVGSEPLLAPLVDLPPGATLAGRARRLADLLDRYAVQRPGLILAWASGHDVGPAGERLPADVAWQPLLFRRVRELVREPSPPERLPGLLARLAEGSLSVELPSRIALFGLSTFPPELGPLLEAIAVRREVRLLFLALSPALTAATARSATALSPPASGDGHPASWSFPRRADPTTAVARHPLLRSWAAPTREFAAQLGVAGLPILGLDETAVGVGDDPDVVAVSLLGRLQRDLRSNVVPQPTHVLDTTDRSIQVHTCAGPTRQIEVVRDVICRLLADDPTLTEGDIVVMSPRIQTFAPLVEAVMGPSADAPGVVARSGGAPVLRYRLTDRAIREVNPVFGALAAVLDLLVGQFTASGVGEVLALGPVRDRFDLSAEDLSLLDGWIDRTNIRWGIDGSHRTRWGLPADFSANTWEAGLDQLLMGVAIGDDGLGLGPGEVAPLGIQGEDVVVAGRIALAVRTLAATSGALAEPRSITRWCEDLRAAADQLFSVPWDETWQRRHLDAVFERLRAAATSPQGEVATVELSLADLRRLLDGHLGGEPARATFGTGAITICSMQPLRSVPHRVVCLLGLDQDALPRASVDGDDLLAQQPDIGDREPRAEARELLLEAVLAARQTLVITHSGTDVRTNQRVAPAVVLDELWDALADTVTSTAEELRATIRVEHPRQAFDPENFVAPPRSFDPVALEGARAIRTRRGPSGPRSLMSAPLEIPMPAEVDLADLHFFLRKPVQSFFRRSLDLRLPGEENAVTDTLPVSLDSLEGWGLGDGLFAVRRQGVDLAAWLRVEHARGALPPAALGAATVGSTSDLVDAMVALATDLGVPLVPRGQHPVDLVVSDVRLVGLVGSCALPPRGGPVLFTYSIFKPSHRLLLWLDLLVLTLIDPIPEHQAMGIGRKSRAKPLAVRLRVRGDGPQGRRDAARSALTGVLDLYREGLCQPVPLFDKTSEALARSPRSKAAECWAGDFGDGQDAHTRLAFGDCSFADLSRIRVSGRSPLEWAEGLWGLYDASVEVDELGRPDDGAQRAG